MDIGAPADPGAKAEAPSARLTKEQQEAARQAELEQQARLEAEAQEDAARRKAVQEQVVAREAVEKEHAEKQHKAEQAAAQIEVARKAAAQARPEGAFGPDILGVRLGMTFTEADAIIKKPGKFPIKITNDEQSRNFGPRFLTGQVYVTADGLDRIAVLWLLHSDRHIVSISRRIGLPLPSISDEQANKVLAEKYGKPDFSSGGYQYWSSQSGILRREDHDGYVCRAITIDPDMGNGFVFDTGGLGPIRNTRSSSSQIEAYEVAQATMGILQKHDWNDDKNVDDVKTCPTTFWAHYDGNAIDPYIMIGVVDGAYAAQVDFDLRNASDNVDAARSVLNGAD